MTDGRDENSQAMYLTPGPGLRIAWASLRKSVSAWVSLICITVFLGVWTVSLLQIADYDQIVATLGLSYPGVVQRHCLCQFITAPILHVGIWHLLFNMLSLWLLGPTVEAAMGRLKYLFFSVVCAVSSMAGFLLVNWGTGRICLGYSGVIFGILVAQAMLFPNQRLAVLGFFLMKMKYAVLLLAAVELYLTISPESGGIANSAHLFGAVAALAFLQAGRLWRGVRVRAMAVRSRGKRWARHRDALRDVPKEL